jgi:hypothetical protein
MKKISVIILLCLSLAVAAQDQPLTQAFYFNITTAVSGGTFTNADSAPTWTLIKNGSTAVATGTFTVVGTGTLAADYYGSLTLNSSTFSAGDTYAIEGTGTISAVPVKTVVMQGRVRPAETTAGYPLVDAHAAGVNSFGSTAFTSNALATQTVGTVSTVTNVQKIGGATFSGTLAFNLDDLNSGFVGNFVRSNTAQGGGAGFITLDSGASASNNTYNNYFVYLLSGTGAGQLDLIIGYGGSTKQATVQTGFSPSPDSSTVFLIFKAPKTNVWQFHDTLQTARDIGSSVIAWPDWAHVQNPTTAVNLSGTTVGTITNYTGNTVQTGDNYARLGAPSGASIAADIATRSTYAGGDTSGVTTLLTRIPGTVQPQTGDSYARLGAPSGASIDADILTRSAPGTAQTITFTQGEADLVWSSATRSLTDKANFSLTVTPPTAAQIWAYDPTAVASPSAGFYLTKTFKLAQH